MRTKPSHTVTVNVNPILRTVEKTTKEPIRFKSFSNLKTLFSESKGTKLTRSVQDVITLESDSDEQDTNSNQVNMNPTIIKDSLFSQFSKPLSIEKSTTLQSIPTIKPNYLDHDDKIKYDHKLDDGKFDITTGTNIMNRYLHNLDIKPTLDSDLKPTLDSDLKPTLDLDLKPTFDSNQPTLDFKPIIKPSYLNHNLPSKDNHKFNSTYLNYSAIRNDSKSKPSKMSQYLHDSDPTTNRNTNSLKPFTIYDSLSGSGNTDKYVKLEKTTLESIPTVQSSNEQLSINHNVDIMDINPTSTETDPLLGKIQDSSRNIATNEGVMNFNNDIETNPSDTVTDKSDKGDMTENETSIFPQSELEKLKSSYLVRRKMKKLKSKEKERNKASNPEIEQLKLNYLKRKEKKRSKKVDNSYKSLGDFIANSNSETEKEKHKKTKKHKKNRESSSSSKKHKRSKSVKKRDSSSSESELLQQLWCQPCQQMKSKDNFSGKQAQVKDDETRYCLIHHGYHPADYVAKLEKLVASYTPPKKKRKIRGTETIAYDKDGLVDTDSSIGSSSSNWNSSLDGFIVEDEIIEIE
ncbi:hypothetical protein HDV02_004708 [Globomyces sp. JEL0801]|nr:hypothetical protein HDV02_004708 [Globomyces sp. JEL0801]